MNEQNKVENLSLLLSRILAFAIDNLIAILILLIAYNYIKSSFKSIYFLLFTLILIYELYFLLFEIVFHKTPGKFLMGLKVIIKDSMIFSDNVVKKFLKYSYEVFIRNLTRVFIFIPPLFFWNELLIILFNKGKTIRDLITSTSVEFSQKLFDRYYQKDFSIE
jgi:uncharacterized RDD family membrane protein YckC